MTLLDAKISTKTQLAQLYRLRREVEVELHYVKTTLGVDRLRGKTPLRSLMWSAGIEGMSPLRLSFQGTRQHLNNFIPALMKAEVRKRQRLRTLLKLIVQQPVLKGFGRVEPRHS